MRVYHPGSARSAIRILIALLTLAALRPPASAASQEPGPAPGISKEAAESAANKVRQIQESSYAGRSFGVVRLSEAEANSYLHFETEPSLPPGISRTRVRFQPGRSQAFAVVDFDKLKEGLKTAPNPIVDYLLQGTHTLGIDGTLSGEGGVGQFHLDSVTLDGVTLPRLVVDYLIDHYLKPRYPGIAVDGPFPLPASIDRLSVEAGTLMLAGRPSAAGRR